MNLRLSSDKNINKEIIQIGRNLHQQALYHTKNYSDFHYAIHELRKYFKEMRAFLRLIRYELGEEVFKNHNTFYKNLGREISWIRDLNVHQETLNKIRNVYGQKLYKNAFAKTEEYLFDILNHTESGTDIDKIINNIHKQLKEYKIDELKVEVKNRKKICKSIKRVYSKGYAQYHQSVEEPTVENLHEWRKSTKYLRYQMSMMRFIWPLMMKAYEKGFRQLAGLLGDDHDLAVLLVKLEDSTLDKNEYDLFTALANNQKMYLQSSAMLLGAKIFMDSPKEFYARLDTYWVSQENSFPSLHFFPQLPKSKIQDNPEI